MKQGVFVCVPGPAGSIQQWKRKGYRSKSAMVLECYPHRVYHRSTR